MFKTNDKKLIIKKFNFDTKLNHSSTLKNEILENGFKMCSYLSKYSHKNIVEIMDLYGIKTASVGNKLDYYLVEEYCLSSLDQFICDFKDELCSSDIKTISDGLANALFYLHSNGIAHQNICTQSVQINERKFVKLGYIECATICYSAKEGCFKNKVISSKQILDLRFVAPEILAQQPIDPIKADVYSYGLILAYCYKRKPFNASNANGDNQATKTEISEVATSLIENCLHKNPENRYYMYDVLTHCYFN